MQHLDEGVIHAWLDGQLPRDEAAAAEAHVAECRQCADAVAEARGLIAASSRILLSLDNVPRGVVPKASTPADVAVPPATVAATPVTSGESDQVIDLRSRVAADARPAIQPSSRRPRRWLNTPALAAAAMVVVAVGTFAVSRVSNRDEISVSSGGNAREATSSADSTLAATPMPARDASVPLPPAAPSPAALGAVARSNEEQQKALVERFATRRLSTTVATDSAAAPASEAKRKQEVAEPAVLADEASRLAKERALPLDTTARRREAGNVVAAMSPPTTQSRVDSLAPQSRADAEKSAADRRDVAAGAQAQAQASATTGSVRGRVTDGNNTAIATAQVTIAGTSIGVTTSASGEFTLGGVPSGARSLLVRRIGYEPVTRELTVVANQTTTVDVTLKPSALSLEQVTTSSTVTVLRGSARARPAAPPPAEAAPGAAVTAGQSNAVGCYEMSITPSSQQGRANFRQTPRRAALDAEIVPSNADGIWYRARDLARTGAVPDGLWRPVGTDGLELEWTYGTRLARIRLTGPASQMMRGTAEEIDRSNGTGEAGSVVAMRASCTS